MPQQQIRDRGRVRHHVHVTGVVQGVGFRPWVYRRVRELGLGGEVRNDVHGLSIQIEGSGESCGDFLRLLKESPPALARIRGFEQREMPARGSDEFRIVASDSAMDSEARAGIMPDLATCPECLRELLDPDDRRYRYPFLNCTQCGPRFTIIDRLPYDRVNTAMRSFPLCRDCRREYEAAGDRRFHAQPVACPRCGPRLTLRDGGGRSLAEGDEALLHTETSIRNGGIAAIKGIGGFHLVCDARCARAVQTLRERKRRPDKPLAILCRDLAQAEELAWISVAERALLTSPAAPIVLLKKKEGDGVAPGVAPGIPILGIMLPGHPLHHLLARDLGFPVVATSGNRSEEPICIDGDEAVRSLAGIADLFLVHDRPIRRAVDDSVYRVIRGEPVCIRNARGCAPLTIDLPPGRDSVFATGGRQKNATALARSGEVILGPHLGSLDHPMTYERFEKQVDDFAGLYGVEPDRFARDLHPDDEAARFADARTEHAVSTQHHHAHVVSCMAEHGLDGEVLGVAWDGTGYGTDGTIWGGEFLVSTRSDFTRHAHLHPFRLPGGEAAVREPARSALGVLHASGLPLSLVPDIAESDREVFRQMLDKSVNCPVTTSAGRLFDAVAALLGIHEPQSFEGAAAMRLEGMIEAHDLRLA
ncbi:MAG: carbamoyltransferase HypF, partial [Gemmatimonadetes bacterium]|nr:carbamoyltransferase HypF [Gemmatimonadota bacterium]